jgi:hypothetical protein
MLGISKINAYKMTVNGTPLFGKADKFITVMGLPQKARVGKNEYSIKTMDDINDILSQNEAEGFLVELFFNGIEMNIWQDKRIMPTAVDFRETMESVNYRKIVFNSDYSLEQFKADFPKSFIYGKNGLIPGIEPLFKVYTQTSGGQYRHFMLYRKSKDNFFVDLLVEFTFKNEKLIYIFFSNVD